MSETTYLSEAPVFTGYPRNEVVIRFLNGEERYLFVNNPLLPSSHGAMGEIEREVVAYLNQHDDAVDATVLLVQSWDERIPQKILSRK